MAKILTETQTIVLKAIVKTGLAKRFYFSGGTALANYYLQHRYSEDLDFFSEEEFNPLEVTTFIKIIKDKVGFTSFDYQSSFNRNLYFLKWQDKNEVLKLEFTYYPFKQIEPPSLRDGLKVDSVLDIAVNKLFTIAQKPRGRDYFDLYIFLNRELLEYPTTKQFNEELIDYLLLYNTKLPHKNLNNQPPMKRVLEYIEQQLQQHPQKSNMYGTRSDS